MVEEAREPFTATATAAAAVRVSLAARPLIAAVLFYQAVGRPLVGGHCRFHPTCSDYALEALRVHGAARGTWLAVRRLLRCHPVGGAGFDPVPMNMTIGARGAMKYRGGGSRRADHDLDQTKDSAHDEHKP